jgi:hypothetical protein
MPTVNVPVEGSVTPERLKLLELEVCEATMDPLAAITAMLTFAIVLLEAFTEMLWPDVPLNVRAPPCPGVDMLTATELPPIVMGPVTPAGTSYRAILIEPVAELEGTTKIVYVPLIGSTTGHMNGALVVRTGPVRYVLLGFQM